MTMEIYRNPNITREGIEVLPGQTWMDLDKRTCRRLIIVERVDKGFAFCRTLHRYGVGRRARISVERMHEHSTGFKLIK